MKHEYFFLRLIYGINLTWSITSLDNLTGCIMFVTHATAPAFIVVPSIMEASISTSLSVVRQEPLPLQKKNYSRDHIKPENFRIRSAWTNFYQTKYICREKISKTIIQEKKFKKTFLKKTFFPHEKNNFRYFLCPPRSLLVDPLHSSIGFSCNVGMTQTKKEANKKHTESK